MTNTNCMALSEVESLLAVHLNKKVQTENLETSKKATFRMEDTILGKLMNKDTKEFFYAKCMIKPISKFGLTSDIASLSVIIFLVCSSMSAYAEGSINYVEKLEKAINVVFNYLKVSGIATLPFIALDVVQQEIESRGKLKNESTSTLAKEEKMNSEDLMRALNLVKALKQENCDFKYNFARSLLNNAEISGNTTLYNEKLLMILADIIEEESEDNLKKLAEHLNSNNPNTIKNASSEFLNNKVVKQLVKSYLPKRS